MSSKGSHIVVAAPCRPLLRFGRSPPFDPCCLIQRTGCERFGRLAPIAKEPTDRVVGRMSPPEAERVAGRVGINLVSLGGGQVVGCLQQAGTECDRLGVGTGRIIDVQIEVDLLRVPMRPFRRDVIGSELNADHPVPVRVEDAVKRVVDEDAAAEHARPKSTLGG
jgi:hypothetical protein